MPRLIPALVGLAALVAAVPSAAQVGSGRIVYSTFSRGIVAVNPDGSGRTALRSTGVRPLWSPDGTRLAGIQDRYPLGPQLFVINADGGGDHVIAEAQQPAGLDVGTQAWSPDGSRLGYVADRSLYTVSAAGGDTRLVATGAQIGPAWSPDGTLLAYTGSDFFVYVIAPDGSGRSQLSDGYGPAWSPDGESIAFLRSGSGLWVMRRDGSGRHRLADLGSGSPAWSADGRQILFLGLAEGRTPEVFVVNSDSSSLRRLTRLGAAALPAPIWSPDSDQILFGSTNYRLLRMNADGSCVDTVASLDSDAFSGSSWQPVPSGPPIGERRCSAIGLDYERTYANQGFGIRVTVRNEGTEPLSAVRFDASTDNGVDIAEVVPSRGYCVKERHRLSCSAHLDRGQSYTVDIQAVPRRYSLIRGNPLIEKIGLHATAPGTLLPTGRENQVVSVTVDRCTIEDPGRGRIDGWFLGDYICGRTGRDLIHPGLGPDLVDAGAGNDVIYANRDNQARDRIDCGPGRDVAVVDRRDRVRDCERVLRR